MLRRGFSVGTASLTRSNLVPRFGVAQTLVQQTAAYSVHGQGAHDKTMTAANAVRLIRSGDTIAVSGFVAQCPPELILRELGDHFERSGQPRDLSLVFHGGPGDWDSLGLNHIAKKGMLSKSIAAHYGQTPKIADLVFANEIEAYAVPMGTISRMIRAGGSGRSAYTTTVGLGTFADPRQGGGKLNTKTTKDLATINKNAIGKTYIQYPAINLNVAIIRGTTADPDGNITMERESLYGDVLIEAMSARANGGLVICQVERLAARGSLNPRMVRVPGALVDVVVIADNVAKDHPGSHFTTYNPAYSGEIRVPMDQSTPMPLTERKVIARRAALNLLPGQVVNLGIGMPEGVASVAGEEGILDQVSLTTEPGTHGGLGASGHDFGPATNYSGLLEMHQQFDFYNGGGLDNCFLGMAEVSPCGDVNVTRVGKKLTGPGGFIDISQCTPRVNLMGTLTAGGLKVGMQDGQVKIQQEGRVKKFVKAIPEITFSADQAKKKGQIVKYITERCVFSLVADGLALTEVAPGIDIQRDILDQMEFKPLMPHEPRLMNPKIFREDLMGLANALERVDMRTRLSYVEHTNTVFIDMSTVTISTREQIDEVVKATTQFFENELNGKRAHAEINRFRFSIHDLLVPEWNSRIAALEAKYYLTARRHFGRTFTHLKAAAPRQQPPETLDVAQALKYTRQHQIPVSEETLRDAFASVAKGRPSLTRQEFAEVVEIISRTFVVVEK